MIIRTPSWSERQKQNSAIYNGGQMRRELMDRLHGLKQLVPLPPVIRGPPVKSDSLAGNSTRRQIHDVV